MIELDTCKNCSIKDSNINSSLETVLEFTLEASKLAEVSLGKLKKLKSNTKTV